MQGLMSFRKLSLTLFALLFLSACATPYQRFPAYSEEVKSHNSVAIVLDLFVYQDLVGMSRGVDSEVYSQTVEATSLKLNEIMSERGFAPQIVAILEGATFNFDPKDNYVISERWKSTGEKYRPISKDESDWYSETTRSFLAHMVDVAKEINSREEVNQEKAEATLAEKSEEPIESLRARDVDFSSLDLSGSDIVLFVKIEGRFQKLGKYLTKGLLFGSATSALTGGFVVVPPGSYAIADIVAFDTETKSILWHGHGAGEFKDSFPSAIKAAMRYYPLHDGSIERRKRRKLIE